MLVLKDIKVTEVEETMGQCLMLHKTHTTWQHFIIRHKKFVNSISGVFRRWSGGSNVSL